LTFDQKADNFNPEMTATVTDTNPNVRNSLQKLELNLSLDKLKTARILL